MSYKHELESQRKCNTFSVKKISPGKRMVLLSLFVDPSLSPESLEELIKTKYNVLVANQQELIPQFRQLVVQALVFIF